MPAIALDRDLPSRHRLPRTPAGVASHGDGGAVVEAPAVIADRPIEDHVGALGKTYAEIVAGQRLADDTV